VGHLDDEVEFSLAGQTNQVSCPRSTGAIDNRFALANLLKQVLDEIVKEVFTITEKYMIRLHLSQIRPGRFDSCPHVAILELARAALLPLSGMRKYQFD
jgi:hypothetical protein